MQGSLDESSRRGSLEIVAQLLDASCHGVRKTELISRCNLSFLQFKKYLELTLKANLIKLENEEPYVLLKLSDKGKEFLKAYQHLKTLLEQ